MLSWRARRRLVYLLIVLGLLLGLGAGLFVIYKPAPSCSDGRQNQDELGPDCGGVCARVCPLEVAPLKVLWTRLFAVAPGKYDVAALIKNPNLRHGTQVFPYVFKIWDSEGLLLSTRRGGVFANPGEEFVVFQSRIEAGQRVPTRVALEFEKSPVWQRLEGPTPALSFTRKDFVNEPTPRLTTTIKNPSLQTINGLEVVAVLSDVEQNAVAASATYLEALAAGAEQELVFTWPEPLAAPVVFIDFYPHFDLAQWSPSPAN